METGVMYELGYHVDPGLDDNAVAQQQAAVEKMVTDSGGAIVTSRALERTRLSYPINRQRASFFGFFRFTLADTSVLTQISEELRLNSSVIRYIVLKVEPEKPRRAPRVRPTSEKRPAPQESGQPNAAMDEQIEQVIGDIQP